MTSAKEKAEAYAKNLMRVDSCHFTRSDIEMAHYSGYVQGRADERERILKVLRGLQDEDTPAWNTMTVDAAIKIVNEE